MDETENQPSNLLERARAARKGSPYLTAKQAAFYLGLGYSTLKKMRRNGTGPRCRKHCRTWRYHVGDLDAWSVARATGEGA